MRSVSAYILSVPRIYWRETPRPKRRPPMKIVVIRAPALLSPILRRICGITKSK